MKEESYLPCPYCNNPPKRVEGVTGAGWRDNQPEDELIYMVSCETKECPAYYFTMSDSEWNRLSVSEELMSSRGPLTQRQEDKAIFEKRIRLWEEARLRD